MDLSNKKITRLLNESESNSNVAPFLSYCAYDVRWNLAGKHPQSGKNPTHLFSKAPKGELPKPKGNQPIGSAGKTMKSK